MRRYLIRYVVFWLPAVVAASLLAGIQQPVRPVQPVLSDYATSQGQAQQEAQPLYEAAVAQYEVDLAQYNEHYRSWTITSGVQWFLAAVMVIGWSVNTGMAAYRYPRTTMSMIFFYTGLSVLIISLKYALTMNSPFYHFMRNWGGVLNYKPLHIFIEALWDYNIPHEVWVTAFLIGCCLVGYVVGIAYRRVKPDPYRPRILGKV